jgi:hypothetical protein
LPIVHLVYHLDTTAKIVSRQVPGTLYIADT